MAAKYSLAKKTYEDGQIFHSRLELLWNAYFTKKGLNFEHETEKRVYDKEKNLYYTPDFTLLNFLDNSEDLYIEIKPEFSDSYVEEEKYCSFVKGESGKRKDSLLLICGYPWGVFSKNYTFKLYTGLGFGIATFERERVEEMPIFRDLLLLKPNKTLFADAYCENYNNDEATKQKYLDACIQEQREGNNHCYKPHNFFLNMVNYYLNGTVDSFQWKDVPLDVWKVASERFDDLEKFIKEGLNANGSAKR